MSNARELADLFGAAASGIEAVLPWKQRPPSGYKGNSWTSQPYMRSDYAQQEAIAAAFRGIAAMYALAADTQALSPAGEVVDL